MSARGTGRDPKAEAFNAAVLWLHERGGEVATLEVFGDAAEINEAYYAQDFERFRVFLWERCKTARKG